MENSIIYPPSLVSVSKPSMMPGIYDFKIHLRSRCRLFLRVERGAVFCAACVCREQDTAQQKRRKIQDQQGNCRQMGQPKLGVEDEACDKDRTDVVGNDK